ncbi:hypothetical protein NELON_01870 [Neisseria elongata subsp. glycolytica ATCC 29315]|uniref:Uncharacterized protein n=1 Tax=Neisseria elongata subsp. glycolytica ATCC 29315 TaxID=546263 RepID=D4DRJ4_NEIEG|nr:hypothetical protein NELON_01870 [Neisseria elongata subsp. glycolytica ATCC 29315]EFE49595.1 hypothetical protein NEIELOOT_01686 [Neisseria elongata subsp. glycolytica ATCC 29315]
MVWVLVCRYVLARIGRLKKVDRILVSDSPHLAEMSDSRIRLLIMSFIGRLKMTSQILWLLHYFQTASLLF